MKPGNIFLESIFNVKLGDFGLARILSEHSNFATTNVGTPFYMSPEQVGDNGYNEKSDIWSLGCVIYELCNLHPPFQAANHLQLAMKIKDGKFNAVNAKYSSELRNVIERMLTVDVNKRVSVDDLLKHPHIAVRIREIRLQQQYAMLKKKEEDLNAREANIEKREKLVENREVELKLREKRLADAAAKMRAATTTGSPTTIISNMQQIMGNGNNNNEKLKTPDPDTPTSGLNKENVAIFKNFKMV